MMKLEDWNVLEDRLVGAFTGTPTLFLHGKVFGSPNFEDGKEIRTSMLIGKEGEVVVTRSGSRYELGEPDEDILGIIADPKTELMNFLPMIN